jgi:hypothetical protein
VNNELRSQSPDQLKKSRSLDECFADKPHLRNRLFEIAEMIDALVAEGCTAHQAEEKAIEQIRQLGNGILTQWAEKAEETAVEQARAGDPKLQPYRKKNS